MAGDEQPFGPLAVALVFPSCDDVEAARQRANELSRPNGHRGPVPSERWRERPPIPSVECWDPGELAGIRRQRFPEEMRKEKGDDELNGNESATAERRAILSSYIPHFSSLISRSE
jgi:hypothetical protein